MEPNTLSNMYNDIKKDIVQPTAPMLHVGFGPGGMNKDAALWKHKAMTNCAALKDECRKHILVDMYCKILPLDDDFIHGHMGKMNNDIDCMLKQKGETPTQYFTSCMESCNAPFVKWLFEATEEMGNEYMKKQDEILDDGQKNNIDLPDPEAADTEDPEVKSQLVDIESDMQYDNFIEILKKKTIDKIVDDVSDIIAGEKEDKDMSFDPVQESTVGVAMDYIQKKVWNESINPEHQEDMIALAIRESTLHEFDCVFNLPGASFKEYASKIRLGKSYLITEEALNELK